MTPCVYSNLSTMLSSSDHQTAKKALTMILSSQKTFYKFTED